MNCTKVKFNREIDINIHVFCFSLNSRYEIPCLERTYIFFIEIIGPLSTNKTIHIYICVLVSILIDSRQSYFFTV